MSRRLAIVLVGLSAALLFATMSFADTPPPGARSTSSATNGAEDFYAGALPPPGLHIIDYNLWYRAGNLKGRSSQEASDPPFDRFSAQVLANVIRPVYVSDAQFLGANPAWHLVIPIVYKNQESKYFHDAETGIGDISFSPLILGWHRAPWHYIVGLDIIAPTGKYSKTTPTSIGNNHWTYEPAVAVTYAGEDMNGFTASAKFMYDYHTPDTDLNYKEGQQFHMDYNAGWAFPLDGGQQLLAGVSGYYMCGLDNDKSSGHEISRSRERVLAIGPDVGYRNGPWFVGLKVLKEMDAKNRPEGWATWLKVIYSFPAFGK